MVSLWGRLILRGSRRPVVAVGLIGVTIALWRQQILSGVADPVGRAGLELEWLAAVTELVRAVMWPAVVLFAVLLFRQRLADILSELAVRATRFSGPGFQVDLERRLEDTRRAYESAESDGGGESSLRVPLGPVEADQPVGSQPNTPSRPVPPHNASPSAPGSTAPGSDAGSEGGMHESPTEAQLLSARNSSSRLAEVSPGAAIEAAWIDVDIEIRKAHDRLRFPQSDRREPLSRILRDLRGVAGGNLLTTVEELIRMKESVQRRAHRRGEPVTTTLFAKNFAFLCADVAMGFARLQSPR